MPEKTNFVVSKPNAYWVSVHNKRLEFDALSLIKGHYWIQLSFVVYFLLICLIYFFVSCNCDMRFVR